MKSLAAGVLSALGLLVLANPNALAQTFAPSPNPAASQTAQLQELTKKIEEQNAKIDMLSQQILKLQQQIGTQRPGVMIGEGAPSPSSSTSATSTSTPSSAESSAKAG